MERISLFVLLSLVLSCAFAQQEPIFIDSSYVHIDEDLGAVFIETVAFALSAEVSEASFLKIKFGNDSIIALNEAVQIKPQRSFSIIHNNIGKTLFFTNLPVITISSAESIVDEPKVPCTLTYSDKEMSLVSYAGIEWRGGSSLGYPKKSYDIELWEDEFGADTRKISFTGLRSDDDWILNGLFVEPLRLRSKFCLQLWLDIHQVHYLNQAPEARAGVDVRYAEVFVNDAYQGIYLLSESIDRKLLKLEKNTQGAIGGKLYKGANWGGGTTFSSLPPYDNEDELWGGYEQKYPKDEINWSSLYAFTDFVMHSSDQAFKDSIWTKFDKQNFIDYFIFLNLVRATDNTGKNIYLAQFDSNDKYFYVPWDLDGSMGTIYNGSRDSTYNDILHTGIYTRLLETMPEGFLHDVAQRWERLSQTTLCPSALISRVETNLSVLKEQSIYEKESLRWGNFIPAEEDADYMKYWIQNRLDFLDDFFKAHYVSHQEPAINFYPNPCTDGNLFFLREGRETAQAYILYNLNGQELSKGQIDCSTPIDLSELSSGLYLIRIGKDSFQIVLDN